MCRKLFLFVAFLVVVKVGISQSLINTPSFPSSVGLFDKFEVSFTLGASYSNPYDPDVISVYAIFQGPDNSSYQIDAFYYEDYTFQKINGFEHATAHPENNGWRIRFTPTRIGTWYFRIVAKNSNGILDEMPNGQLREYSFTCTSVNSAEGFIYKANSRFLKQEVVEQGIRRFHSFYPIGPNVAWYSCDDYGTFSKPNGIYDYEMYIDSLDGRANYMRVWLNRYQYLSLYGPEYTQTDLNGAPIVYFDSSINQKDSAELDQIMAYAKQHGISVLLCFFSYGDFNDSNGLDPNDPSKWSNNPFNTQLGLESPCDFFTDHGATKITQHLIRYIVSRWGYSTNIVGWEFWNEVNNMFGMCEGNTHIEQDVKDWHDEMFDYLRAIDPYQHCVTTSVGGESSIQYLYSTVFIPMDFVQCHRYESIQNAESRHQMSYRLLKKAEAGLSQYPTKPFFFGEFGFAQRQNTPTYAQKDPWGIDLHNSLWTSFFSNSMGSASFWWWPYVNTVGLYHHFLPLLVFAQNLPILSDSFTAHITGIENGRVLQFPNNIQTYYIINESEDTIYGWSQDTAFAYQSLRWLTDSVYTVQTNWGPLLQFKPNAVFDPLGYVYTLNVSKRPSPSSNSNIITIPITNQPVGKAYIVKWYDSETGNAINSGTPNFVTVQQDAQGNKYVSFQFPSTIRNLQQNVINNNFGDAVFRLVLNHFPH